jgi:hypothetical protein
MEITFPWVSLTLSAMTPREQLRDKGNNLDRVKAPGCYLSGEQSLLCWWGMSTHLWYQRKLLVC